MFFKIYKMFTGLHSSKLRQLEKVIEIEIDQYLAENVVTEIDKSAILWKICEMTNYEKILVEVEVLSKGFRRERWISVYSGHMDIL